LRIPANSWYVGRSASTSSQASSGFRYSKSVIFVSITAAREAYSGSPRGSLGLASASQNPPSDSEAASESGAVSGNATAGFNSASNLDNNSTISTKPSV